MADPPPTPAVSPAAPERSWHQSQRLREELFERARFGRITGEQADAEAERLGLGSLSRRPDATAFDPGREDYWTLPMAVAWIAYRNNDAVCEAWDKYCAECWHWVWQKWRVGFDGDVHEGWHLEQWRRPTLARLALGEAFDRADSDNGKPPIMTVKESREALWSALQENFFSASGIETQTERRVAIPALHWRELVPVEGHGEVDEVRYGLLGSGYRDVLVPGKGLRMFWKEPREKPLDLPPLVPPHGDGFIPLYCAAQWIATKGGTVAFDPEDEPIWRSAFDDLLAAMSSEKVRVVGTSAGQRELVPGYVFAGVCVDYPFGSAELDVLAAEDLYLRSYPYLDEEHWRGGLNDALMNRRQERWTQLMVAKDDVRMRWPFSGIAASADLLATGLPGRPMKSKHLLDAELQRRAVVGQLCATLSEEADALLTWLLKTHPSNAPPTKLTIENNIRDEYRRLKPTK
jgi:hypothetical protein